jgi:hypothetical protein
MEKEDFMETRICKTCSEEKPLDIDYLIKNIDNMKDDEIYE